MKILAGIPEGSAALGHRANDAYMEEWHAAYAAMGGQSSSRSHAPSSGRSSRREAHGGALGSLARPLRTAKFPPSINDGPRDPAGRLVDVSDRPLLCMSVDVPRSRAVIGGSDHSLYEIDIAAGRTVRELYSRSAGHSEWVTCVGHLPDGRPVSGGMDNKLCVWDTRAVRAVDLVGHSSSVSTLDCAGSYVVSGSYDKTVRMWSADGGAHIMCLQHHKAPVLTLQLWSEPSSMLAVSGDRDGVGYVWDLSVGKSMGRLTGHKGHLTSVCWLPPGHASNTTALAVTGAQDGHVRVWDVRARRQVANLPAHTSAGGSGAVTDMSVPDVAEAGGSYLVTAGADQRICVLDAAAGFSVRSIWTDHNDFIYSLECFGKHVLSGSGNGLLMAHDLAADRILWAAGANEAAVRAIGATPDSIVAAGDDGKIMIYDL